MALYLERVQWAVRPVTALPCREKLGPVLPVDVGPIRPSEVLSAAAKLKSNRVVGDDNVPAEFWAAIINDGSLASTWAVEFCQLCWSRKAVPMQWHTARVAMLFKKGDMADTSNYRPISLLCIGYKLFVSVLLARLKAASAEERVWSTQFGFRSGSGTAGT